MYSYYCLFTCILILFFSHSKSETITCGSCSDNIQCQTSNACTIRCTSTDKCKDATIDGGSASSFTIECIGSNSCSGNAVITCAPNADCLVKCMHADSCIDVEIDATLASSFLCTGNCQNAESITYPPPSKSPTNKPTLRPTVNPTTFQPTDNPTTSQPTDNPTLRPTINPTTFKPSIYPSTVPTLSPSSMYPTAHPSAWPTAQPISPTAIPTSMPSELPTFSTAHPSTFPSHFPTALPTTQPTSSPTHMPTTQPSMFPTSMPTNAPSALPTTQPVHPTSSPTHVPTTQPSMDPTSMPTNAPSALPSVYPSVYPTEIPSMSPTSVPSSVPSTRPTYVGETYSPTFVPTAFPIAAPSIEPTTIPSVQPTAPTTTPTTAPTAIPTTMPTINPSSIPTAYPTIPSMVPTSDPVIPVIRTTGISQISNNNADNAIPITLIIIVGSAGVVVFFVAGAIGILLFRRRKKIRAESYFDDLNQRKKFNTQIGDILDKQAKAQPNVIFTNNMQIGMNPMIEPTMKEKINGGGINNMFNMRNFMYQQNQRNINFMVTEIGANSPTSKDNGHVTFKEGIDNEVDKEKDMFTKNMIRTAKASVIEMQADEDSSSSISLIGGIQTDKGDQMPAFTYNIPSAVLAEDEFEIRGDDESYEDEIALATSGGTNKFVKEENKSISSIETSIIIDEVTREVSDEVIEGSDISNTEEGITIGDGFEENQENIVTDGNQNNDTDTDDDDDVLIGFEPTAGGDILIDHIQSDFGNEESSSTSSSTDDDNDDNLEDGIVTKINEDY